MGKETRTCSIDGCSKPAKARGWCKKHWQRWSRKGDPLAVQYEVEIGLPKKERFERKVDKSSGCWVWLASLGSTGYGQFSVDNRPRKAHRVSYEMYRGPIPAGIFVCHSCDNRLCVNPDHLFLGTSKDNLQDMASKGRSCHGESRHNAKLTDEKVRFVRNSTQSNRALARLCGVSEAAIRNAKAKRTWRHVE